MNTYLIHSPLSIPISSRKNFSLNLNQYRNAHFMVLNNAKRNYASHMSKILNSMNIKKNMDQILLTYKLFPGTKRRLDVHNVCSVVDKFFCDVLVEEGYIEDDNFDHVLGSLYLFGGIDRENPRVEIYIHVLKEKDMNFTISEKALKDFVQSQIEELVEIKDGVNIEMQFVDGSINVELVKSETKSTKSKTQTKETKIEEKQVKKETQKKEEETKEEVTYDENLPFDDDVEEVEEKPATKSTSLFSNLGRDSEVEVEQDTTENTPKAPAKKSIFG